MHLKDFINNFDFDKPDWSNLPDGWPEPDMTGLISAEVGNLAGIKTLWLLAKPNMPEQKSRTWTDPDGYKFLVQWSNAVLLRYLIRKLTDTLPHLSYYKTFSGRSVSQVSSPLPSSNNPLSSFNRPSEHRRKAQLDDAARSVVRNIEEGYKRATTKEYIDFIGYSQGSLEEVKGDIVELAQDGFLKTRPGSSLKDLGLDLGAFNKALKDDKGGYRNIKDDKGGYRNVKDDDKGAAVFVYRPLEILYPPLSNVRGEDLTVEQFIELINKTDYLFRKLVESLELKLNKDHKFYQVERARIKGRIKGRIRGR